MTLKRIKQSFKSCFNFCFILREFMSLFLENIFTAILKCDQNLVKNIYHVLVAVSCQKKLNIQSFTELCTKTARQWVKQFDYYYMPVTLHKLLIHGNRIISSFYKSFTLLHFFHFSQLKPLVRQTDKRSNLSVI